MDIIRKPKVSNVKMLDKCQSLIQQNSTDLSKTHNTILGTLYLTATHLIFIDNDAQQETWILHSQLSSITKHPVVSDGTPIQIKCKNFCTNTFIIPKEKDAHDLYTSLYQISQPIKLSDLYCFHYTAPKEPFQFNRQLGWNKFNLIDEFNRQDIPKNNWTLTKLNENYGLCETYPKILFVPSSATDQILIASSKFRSKERLPVLSYFYKYNSAVICRCSQPLSGLSQRSVEDEALLNCILNANNQNQTSKLLYVVDTRPKVNAMANRAIGKGYENINFYENIKFHFFGIENIHVMRGSLQKLLEACEIKVPVNNNFISGIANSSWLKHVRSVLETSYFVAKTVESGISVIVHCSDGWDRTAQTCSIANLILDPYYRTIDGFQCLIEKEWLSFGHKFTDRCGHILIGDSKEVAPVFTQFIDAVWQITQQFPNEFEFNENYLLTIHDHVFSCQFGTFIGNCEKERVDLDLKNLTYSLWAYLDSQKDQFINPLYKIKKNERKSFLQVQLYPQLIRFWRNMYNRFDFGIHPRENLNNILMVTYNHNKSLEGHINFLKKKISEIEKSQKNNLTYRLKESSDGSLNSSLITIQECMERMKFNKKLKDDIGNSIKNLKAEELLNCIQTVALDWQSFRSIKKCLCGSLIEQTNTTINCWSCGLLYCIRCIEKRIKLPGHYFDLENSENLSVLEKNEKNFKKNNESLKKNYISHPLEELNSDHDINLKKNIGNCLENNELILNEKTRKKKSEVLYQHVPVCMKCYKTIAKTN